MYPISNAMVAVLVFNILASIAIPTLLFIIFKRRFGCRARSFFYGVATFFLFALVLEQVAHLVVFRSALGPVIGQSTWLFAFYGGIMAGLFEESGRFIVFSTLMKKRMANDHDALMFASGHAGLEVILIFGLAMGVNLYYVVMAKTGRVDLLLASMAEPKRLGVEAILASLSSSAAPLYLLGLVERCIAVVLHMSFSALVWVAVKERSRGHLFWLAVFLHAGVDTIAVLLSRGGVSALLIEALLILASLLCALIARRVWRSEAQHPDKEAVEVG